MLALSPSHTQLGVLLNLMGELYLSDACAPMKKGVRGRVRVCVCVCV